MALVIETGAGIAGAQAYADADDYIAWHLAYYGATPTNTQSAIEAGILRSMAFLEAQRWVGARVSGRTQALAWPRTYALDADGNEIAETEVPAEVIFAQHAFTRAELANPGALSPDVTLAGQKVLTQVDVLQWEVQKVPNTVESLRLTVTAAMDKIKPLIVASGATRILARA